MARSLTRVAAVLVWLSAATTVWAQADPLAAIPDDALGFAVIGNLADTSARMQKLTQKMQLPLPELLPMVQGFTGVQKGLDRQGGLAAAVFVDSKNQDPDAWGLSLAIFVPVADYQEFIAQLDPKDPSAAIAEVTVMGQPFLTAQKTSFAVLVSPEQKHVLDKVLASTQSVAGGLEPVRAWLNQQQAAVVLTVAGKKMLFEKVNGYLDTGIKALGDNESKAGDPKADNPKAEEGRAENADEDEAAAPNLTTLRQMLEGLRDLLAAAEPELQQIGIGVRIDDSTALHISTRMSCTAGGALAAWSKKVELPAGGLLSGLSASRFVIAYGGVAAELHPVISNLVKKFTENGLEQMGLNEEDLKKYADAEQKQHALRTSMAGVMGQLRAGESIAATAVSLERVKDSAEYMKLARETFGSLAGAKSENGTPIYDLKEVALGELKALEVVTDLNAMMARNQANAGMAEQMQGFMSKLFGADGQMRIYITAADEHTVVSAYSKELLERSVNHVRTKVPGLEADPQIVSTAALLPAGAQWAAYVSPQGLLQWVDLVLRQMLPPEMNFRIPLFPPSDPIGLAARVSENGVDAEIVLPESVVAGIGQYVGLVQQMMQGGGGPLP